MTQHYVGVKIVTAWEQEKDGLPGYGVTYEDGYQSWSPKETFERFYLPMGEGQDGSRVTKQMVEDFMGNVVASQLDAKTTLVVAETITGFRQHEVSSCVDPKNFDMQIGADICKKRIADTLWKCLGFVVQWGRFGLSKKYKLEGSLPLGPAPLPPGAYEQAKKEVG